MSAPPRADTPIRVDARGRQHGVPRSNTLLARNTWLHVSNIDRFLDLDDVRDALRAALPPSLAVLRCEVAGFADAAPYEERRRRDQAKCHQVQFSQL